MLFVSIWHPNKQVFWHGSRGELVSQLLSLMSCEDLQGASIKDLGLLMMQMILFLLGE